MNNFKRTIALIMCLVLSLGSLAYAEDVMLISEPIENDYEGHWAQATIQKWMDEGRVSGYPDGSYKPDNKVTRAEFVKMVNGIIDFNKMSTITYNDVQASEWFYDYIRLAQSIGYISGYSTTMFGPNDYITREQAASIVARIQYLKDNAAGADKFIDKNIISSWAVEAVGAASEAVFIKGYEDESFKPQNNLTRAEALTMLDNVLVNAKNVIIYNAGTELKDQVIEGDLIIAKTVGNGSVKLTNLTVKGEVRVYGGKVTLSGNFGVVRLSGSENVTLNDAVITKLIVDEKITILGKGTIKTIVANADGILYEKDVVIEKVELGEGVTVPPAVIVETGGGGGGGGFIPDPTPENPIIQIAIKSPDEAYSKVFNTDKFTEDKLIYDAVVAILGDAQYTDLINKAIEKSLSRADDLKVDEVSEIDLIWDKFESYLAGTSIQLTGLETAVKAGELKNTHIIAALNEFKNAPKTDLEKILANIELDKTFDNIKFKYLDKVLTYTLTSSAKATMPTTYTEIAEFLINEILVPNKTIGAFLEEYGTVALEAELVGSDKTASISIGNGVLQ